MLKPKGKLSADDSEGYFFLFLAIEALAVIGLITVISWILKWI